MFDSFESYFPIHQHYNWIGGEFLNQSRSKKNILVDLRLEKWFNKLYVFVEKHDATVATSDLK